jgi:hypothetical protein
MSCMASATWSHAVLSLYCTKPSPSRGAILSGRITTIAMSRSGQLGRHCTVGCTLVACMFAGASVMHERALETGEPSCVPRAAKPFIIHVVHSPPGAVGHVAAPELPSARRRGPRAIGHVAAPELTSVRR